MAKLQTIDRLIAAAKHYKIFPTNANLRYMKKLIEQLEVKN